MDAEMLYLELFDHGIDENTGIAILFKGYRRAKIIKIEYSISPINNGVYSQENIFDFKRSRYSHAA